MLCTVLFIVGALTWNPTSESSLQKNNLDHKSEKAIIHDSIHFSCDPEVSMSSNFRWEFINESGQNISLVEDKNYDLNTWYTIHIRNVGKMNQGEYLAYYNGSIVCRIKFKVLDVETVTVYSRIGERFTIGLPKTANFNNRYHWARVKDNKTIMLFVSPRYTFNYHNLVIKNVTEEDNGIYIIRNYERNTLHVVYLIVKEDYKTETVIMQDTAWLSCSPNNVSWNNFKWKFVNESGHSISVYNDDSYFGDLFDLYIPKVEKRHQGMYVGLNQGLEVCAIRFKVQDVKEVTMYRTIGQSVKIIFPNNNSHPVKYRWYKVYKGRAIVISKSSRYAIKNNTLDIMSVTREDNATFEVRHGNTLHIVHLVVESAYVIANKSEMATIQDSAILFCSPNKEWWGDFEWIFYDDSGRNVSLKTDESYDLENLHTIIIKSVEKRHQGNYDAYHDDLLVCTITFKVQEVETVTVYGEIGKPIHFTYPNTLTNVGYYHWVKVYQSDATIIERSDRYRPGYREFNITHVKREDFGTFEVRNRANSVLHIVKFLERGSTVKIVRAKINSTRIFRVKSAKGENFKLVKVSKNINRVIKESRLSGKNIIFHKMTMAEDSYGNYSILKNGKVIQKYNLIQPNLERRLCRSLRR